MRKSIIAVIWLLLSSSGGLAGPVSDAAKNGDAGEIQSLLASGADPNEADRLASPLHWAAMKGHVEAVRVLLNEGADLEAQSSLLGTPLHASARMGQIEALSLLVAAGANLDAMDKDQFTPLMRAVIENRIAVVDMLLSAGADFNVEGFSTGGDPAHGPTIALHLAERLERNEIVKLLKTAGAGPVPPEVPTNLLTSGNAERGRELASKRCGACHHISVGSALPLNQQLSDGNDEIIAPSLIGLMGRPVADLEYEYSNAVRALGGHWTPERLYQFVYRPMLTAPGTRMFWPPELSSEQVADIVAFFASEAE